MLGVIVCKRGAKVLTKSSKASFPISLAFVVEYIIGSKIIGHLVSLSAPAVALMAETLWTIPIFTASGGMSFIILKTWLEIKSAPTDITSVTSRVFCTVIAVIAVQA